MEIDANSVLPEVAVVISYCANNITIIGHGMGGMVGTLLLQEIPEKITALINLEGNLVLEDCGTSKEVDQLDFNAFKDYFKDIKRKLERSKEPSAPNRTKWVSHIPDYAFYKSSRSIVRWSETNELLSIFLNAQCKKLFV